MSTSQPAAFGPATRSGSAKSSKPEPDGAMLRVRSRSGGCSGFHTVTSRRAKAAATWCWRATVAVVLLDPVFSVLNYRRWIEIESSTT